ncbi:hypothetical protein GCM10023235_41020 [Kitasatospora terrestris]|uniref:Uncharacterized protein n=1 Tax=Kitasatospora terrestris TaxID=258051 RepID=A0ABP9DWK1_9ACTN
MAERDDTDISSRRRLQCPGRSFPMVWQFFVLVIASIGFPTLALLYMIGGLEYHDRRQP